VEAEHEMVAGVVLYEILWLELLIVPPVSATQILTDRLAELVGLLILQCTEPLPGPLLHLTLIEFNGVPLLDPIMVPPVTDQDIVELLLQPPKQSEYWYVTFPVAQVGPFIHICASTNVEIETKNAMNTPSRIAACNRILICFILNN